MLQSLKLLIKLELHLKQARKRLENVRKKSIKSILDLKEIYFYIIYHEIENAAKVKTPFKKVRKRLEHFRKKFRYKDILDFRYTYL